MTQPSWNIKPSQDRFRQVRTHVSNTLKSCAPVLQKQKDFEVELSRGEISSANSTEDNIQIVYGEDDQRLKGMSAAGYYRSWFMEHRKPSFQWEEMLRLGGSLLFSERTTSWSVKGDAINMADVEKSDLQDSLDETTPALRANGFILSYKIAKALDRQPSELVDCTKTDVVSCFETLK